MQVEERSGRIERRITRMSWTNQRLNISAPSELSRRMRVDAWPFFPFSFLVLFLFYPFFLTPFFSTILLFFSIVYPIVFLITSWPVMMFQNPLSRKKLNFIHAFLLFDSSLHTTLKSVKCVKCVKNACHALSLNEKKTKNQKTKKQKYLIPKGNNRIEGCCNSVIHTPTPKKQVKCNATQRLPAQTTSAIPILWPCPTLLPSLSRRTRITPTTRPNNHPYFSSCLNTTCSSTLSQAIKSIYAYIVGQNSLVPVANNCPPSLNCSHQILPRGLRSIHLAHLPSHSKGPNSS